MKLVQDMGVSKSPFVIDLLHERNRPFGYYYHSHQGMEFLYVHKGRGQVIVNRKCHAITPGTLLLFQPFQLHRVQMEDVSPETPYVRSVVTFEPSLFDSYLQPFPALQQFFHYLWKSALPSQMLHVDERDDYFHGLLDHYNRKFATLSANDGYEESVLFTVQMLSYIRSRWNAEDMNVPKERRSHHAQNILEWIEDHYAEPFDLGSLAADMHLSKYHVSHLFKQFTGSTINEYWVARRIRQACWLLQTGSLPVHEIGLQVGYDNPSYFCRLFRKVTGLTPQAYRKAQEPL